MTISSAFLLVLVLLLLLAHSGDALLSIFSNQKGQRQQLKEEILGLASRTNRGLDIDSADVSKMAVLFAKLEKLNPTRAPLESGLVSGVWDLKYTTSAQILGNKTFRRVGPILQTLDTKALTAENSEVVDYKLFRLSRKVSAELKPVSPSEVAVQFKQFSFGPGDVFKIKAPEAFKGSLDVTYVDADFRLSRGDKGNIFVLTRV